MERSRRRGVSPDCGLPGEISPELTARCHDGLKIHLRRGGVMPSVAFSNFGADDGNIFFLPTFIVSASYHKLSPPGPPNAADDIAQKGREFTDGEYAQAHWTKGQNV